MSSPDFHVEVPDRRVEADDELSLTVGFEIDKGMRGALVISHPASEKLVKIDVFSAK